MFYGPTFRPIRGPLQGYYLIVKWNLISKTRTRLRFTDLLGKSYDKRGTRLVYVIAFCDQ